MHMAVFGPSGLPPEVAVIVACPVSLTLETARGPR